MAMTQATMHALLVTLDPGLVTTFTDVSREVGIETQKSVETPGVPDELSRTKYEALIVDFDTVSQALPIIASVRESRSNKNAVVMAVATTHKQKQEALQEGANFVFERPFEKTEIRRVLSAAYDLMIGERRRYFRCAADLPVRAFRKSSGTSVECVTTNISSSGMALKAPVALNSGEDLILDLTLPDVADTVRAGGTVIWDDKHGKTGLSIQCAGAEMQKRLDLWLDSQFSGVPSFQGSNS
jgi:hypothetical protein